MTRFKVFAGHRSNQRLLMEFPCGCCAAGICIYQGLTTTVRPKRGGVAIICGIHAEIR